MALHRRKMLRAAAGAAVLIGSNRFEDMLAAQGAPAVIKRDGARPALEEGVAVGDVLHDRALIWSRCDRPARMIAPAAAIGTFFRDEVIGSLADLLFRFPAQKRHQQDVFGFQDRVALQFADPMTVRLLAG